MSKSHRNQLNNNNSNLDNHGMDEERFDAHLQQIVEDVKCGKMKTCTLEEFREMYEKRIQEKLS